MFNKFNVTIHLKTLMLRYLNIMHFLGNMNSAIIITLEILKIFHKNCDTSTTLTKKKVGNFYKILLNVIHHINNGCH